MPFCISKKQPFFSKSGAILMQKSFLWDKKPVTIQPMGNISEASLFSGREDAYMTTPEYIAHTREDLSLIHISKPTSWLFMQLHILFHLNLLWDLSCRSGLFPF